MSYSLRFEHALQFAARAHGHQTRKQSTIPYLVHPVHVAAILARRNFTEDCQIAGLLHDVVEDADVPLSVIEEKFGEHVAEIVAGMTEKKLDLVGTKRPWKTRKEEVHETLRTTPVTGVIAVKLADALHNLQSTIQDVQTHGPAVVLKRFNSDTWEEQLWYYAGIAKAVSDREDLSWNIDPLLTEFMCAVQDLQKLVS